MKIECIEFYSDGHRLRGVLKTPTEQTSGPWPVLVNGPGWLETVGDSVSEPFHEGLVAGGYAVLQFDYRGFGKSDGPTGWVRPYDQQIDICNAIVYASTRDDLDTNRLGLFALGATGPGNAIYVAARDERVRAVCAQSVVADGTQWLHEQRREWEWVELKRRVEENRRSLVMSNQGELVDPVEEIMVATPERKRKGMPLRGDSFHLASIDFLRDFRPAEAAARLRNCSLLLTCVEDDVVTPEHHARELFDASTCPKRLIIQSGVSHYESYITNYAALMEHFLEWYGRYLRAVPQLSREHVSEVIELKSLS